MPTCPGLDCCCQVHSVSGCGGQSAKGLPDARMLELRQHPDGRRHHQQMAKDRRDIRNHQIPSKSEEAENRTSNARDNGCDGYEPRPSAQFQYANCQADANTCENQQRKSARNSHSGDCHGDRLCLISAGHSMTAMRKKAAEPRARPAEAKNVRTAMIITPAGRFTLLPCGKRSGQKRRT